MIKLLLMLLWIGGCVASAAEVPSPYNLKAMGIMAFIILCLVD